MEQLVYKYNHHEDKLTNFIKYLDAHRRTKYSNRHVVEFEMSNATHSKYYSKFRISSDVSCYIELSYHWSH